jgi:UDP-glucose 4-epimerase
MTAPRVFLSGGSGFIGARVATWLAARDYSVCALEHRTRVAIAASQIVHGELERPSEIFPALRGCDAVVHAAALLDPIDDLAAAERVNHRATVELARAAARAGVKTFVFVSSFAAVGAQPNAGLVPPEAECRPTTHYGRSKLAAERSLAELGALGDLGAMRIVIWRPPTVYGPGERRNFLALVRAIDTGLFLVPGDGENRMSFCSIENLADAIGWSLVTASARGILHVADEPVLTFRQAVATIAGALDRRLLPIPFPLPAARTVALACEVAFRPLRRAAPLNRMRLATLTADSALDTAASARLGFRPAHRFADSVAETIAEYRRAGLLRKRRRSA